MTTSNFQPERERERERGGMSAKKCLSKHEGDSAMGIEGGEGEGVLVVDFRQSRST